MPGRLTFDVLPEPLSLCRLAAADGVPDWAFAGDGFWSVSRRADELSVMGPADAFPASAGADGPWRALAVRGPMDLSLVGVAAAFTAPLAAARIAVMPVATYDTDVVLVRAADLPLAVDVLRGAGFVVHD
jgi:uncharacterized protein